MNAKQSKAFQADLLHCSLCEDTVYSGKIMHYSGILNGKQSGHIHVCPKCISKYGIQTTFNFDDLISGVDLLVLVGDVWYVKGDNHDPVVAEIIEVTDSTVAYKLGMEYDDGGVEYITLRKDLRSVQFLEKISHNSSDVVH